MRSTCWGGFFFLFCPRLLICICRSHIRRWVVLHEEFWGVHFETVNSVLFHLFDSIVNLLQIVHHDRILACVSSRREYSSENMGSPQPSYSWAREIVSQLQVLYSRAEGNKKIFLWLWILWLPIANCKQFVLMVLAISKEWYD